MSDVALLKSAVRNQTKVKAAGGIRNLQTAMNMIHAGADRLGTTASVSIMEEFKALTVT